MAVNYFIGKSQAWLETELAKAQADLAAAKTIISAGSGDVNVQKMVQGDAERRIERILAALYAIDPDTYPATSVFRTTRTRYAAYQGS